MESFKWHVQPQALPIRGAFYTDGSARGGPIKELVRCGWSFVAVNSQGEVIAAAYGAPPPRVEDIGGAEVWGLYQALLVSIPSQSKYWVDCLPFLTAVEKGGSVAKDPRNPLARAHALVMPILDEVEDLPVG